ncbi:hypothetical protein CDAR_412401 [Caerostris darwini]|uniref:Uncharacterized protein n=1 Tax=Caerostris darwini TaxID=1538125 RepID=A0AAV4SWW6_9ARAC|nr:hypothetical protein CDAR_412401 [Caerostris darwini]
MEPSHFNGRRGKPLLHSLDLPRVSRKSPSTCFGIIPTNKVTLVFRFVSDFGIILPGFRKGQQLNQQTTGHGVQWHFKQSTGLG